jgi:hypothetical protein
VGTNAREGFHSLAALRLKSFSSKFFVYDECGMVCNERIRLLDEYAAATSAYRSAFAKVRQAKEAGAGLSEVLLASKAARETCAKARLALRHHKIQHGC